MSWKLNLLRCLLHAKRPTKSRRSLNASRRLAGDLSASQAVRIVVIESQKTMAPPTGDLLSLTADSFR
jgi:hypothetical protein